MRELNFKEIDKVAGASHDPSSHNNPGMLDGNSDGDYQLTLGQVVVIGSGAAAARAGGNIGARVGALGGPIGAGIGAVAGATAGWLVYEGASNLSGHNQSGPGHDFPPMPGPYPDGYLENNYPHLVPTDSGGWINPGG
ncbi:MAG: hypothetical protein AAFQ24_03560 [Pseudomonadota bacterium]